MQLKPGYSVFSFTHHAGYYQSGNYIAYPKQYNCYFQLSPEFKFSPKFSNRKYILQSSKIQFNAGSKYVCSFIGYWTKIESLKVLLVKYTALFYLDTAVCNNIKIKGSFCLSNTGYSFWDCAIFSTNLHELFCQFISWTDWVNL